MATMGIYQAAARTALRRQINSNLQRSRFPKRANSTAGSNETAAKAASKEAPPQLPKESIWMRMGPLTKAVQAYARAAKSRPYVTQIFTSMVIFGVGDLSSQAIGTKDYEVERTGRAIVIGTTMSIPVYLWFQLLATSFNCPSKVLSVAMRVAVNQAVFTPVNNTWFFGMQKFLAGGTWEQVKEHVWNTVPTTWYNAFKVWPAVMALNFAFVPRQFIPVVSGVVAMGWQTYLSYLNRRTEESAAAAVMVVEPIGRPLVAEAAA